MSAFEEYKLLLKVLMAFKDADEKMLESLESDIIRDMMDPLWYDLTDEEMNAIEEWSAQRKPRSK